MNTHLGFVIIAYGVTVVALMITICWIIIDQRLLKRELQRLEAQGLRRRSAKPVSETA
ncbi:heme exporter protein CcmD [Brucella sp. BE17]|uniref:heme exporter protein CcmD n=1 Tax=Brucella sp. BE17 TaxID=3142977 RepID=UPI0031BA3A00